MSQMRTDGKILWSYELDKNELASQRELILKTIDGKDFVLLVSGPRDRSIERVQVRMLRPKKSKPIVVRRAVYPRVMYRQPRPGDRRYAIFTRGSKWYAAVGTSDAMSIVDLKRRKEVRFLKREGVVGPGYWGRGKQIVDLLTGRPFIRKPIQAATVVGNDKYYARVRIYGEGEFSFTPYGTPKKRWVEKLPWGFSGGIQFKNDEDLFLILPRDQSAGRAAYVDASKRRIYDLGEVETAKRIAPLGATLDRGEVIAVYQLEDVKRKYTVRVKVAPAGKKMKTR